jgi:hypothetical protein
MYPEFIHDVPSFQFENRRKLMIFAHDGQVALKVDFLFEDAINFVKQPWTGGCVQLFQKFEQLFSLFPVHVTHLLS